MDNFLSHQENANKTQQTRSKIPEPNSQMQSRGKWMIFSVTRVGLVTIHVKNINLNPIPATESTDFMQIIGPKQKV